MGVGRGRPGIPRIPRPPLDPSREAFCTRCKEVKSRAAFPKNKNSPNGLHSWCLECNNSATYAWDNDPANYRRRRDSQAMNTRRHHAKLRGKPVKQGPIKARYQEPRTVRKMQ